ncbi:hypothetical protein BOW52_09195 [Solemya elarraichensis gill symbiont]|uniref:Uncharacterized protein n=2 Tax=Solemya elarraichensis gill symbiont TaxID=1918949 RepID=A0A1T2KZ72_9GAMM|nr:hypothetical protein BOW52_09195 [Solemya elarraichensis gill symbiont]
MPSADDVNSGGNYNNSEHTESDNEFRFVTNKKTRVRKRLQKRMHPASSDEEDYTQNKSRRTHGQKHYPASKTNQDFGAQKHIAVISGDKIYSKLEVGDITVTNFIRDTIGTAKSVKRTRKGEIAVECHSAKHLQTLLSQTSIANKNITVRQPKNLLQTQGVIKKVGLSERISEVKNELNKNDHFHPVIDVRRLQNRHRQDSQAVLITFKGHTLPKSVYIGFMEYKVEKYIRHPLRCTTCQGYNHSANECKSKIKCPRCSGEHKYSECTVPDTDKKCPNCGNPHSAGYKGCTYHKTQVKIIKTQTLDNISYASAVKRVKTQAASTFNNNAKTNTNNYIIEPPKPQRPARTPRPRTQPKPHTQTSSPTLTSNPTLTHKSNQSITNPQPNLQITLDKNKYNATITVDIVDFLNFFREAARVVALGAVSKEPSESVRDRLTLVANTCLGTNIPKGELQKQNQQNIENSPEKWGLLNSMIASLINPTDKLSRKNSNQQHKTTHIPLTPDIQVIDTTQNTQY